MRACASRYTTAWLVCVLLSGCATLPERVAVEESQAVPADERTTLGRRAAAMVGLRPGESAIVIEDTGRAALRHRAALIEVAERSIDIQYYIWNTDRTGDYLAARLLLAAERGVRVRLLLDDLHFAGEQATMQQLDSHANIEVRTYNPTRARGVTRWFSFLWDFGRLNRRLHNKTFVVDGAVGITGGRNIGDEYFDLHAEMNFRDRDLLAVGPVVQQMSDCFDAYWNSEWSFSLASVATDDVADGVAPHGGTAADEIPVKLPRDRRSALELLDRVLADAVRAPAEFAWDPAPDDLAARADVPKRTAVLMAELVAAARDEVLIESGYLLLEHEDLEDYAALRQSGVRVVVLTNSLASNNLVTNHSGYARWRGRMADEGLQLHELRPHPEACTRWIGPHGRCGEAVVSLHSKSAVIDGSTLYVGSFNFNQRSIYLNAESIVIVHSSRLAGEVAEEMRLAFDRANSWQLRYDEDGELTWLADDGKTWTREPASTAGRRLRSWLYARFPVEKYL